MASNRTDASVSLRAATMSDAEPVWHCRQGLLDTAAVQSAAKNETYDTHLAWFGRAMSDPERLFLIIEKDHEWLGYVRIDPLAPPPGHRVSIALVPAARGSGVGGAALSEACIRAEQAGFVPLYADIAISNPASRRIFEKCGFTLLSADVSSGGFQRFIRRS